MIRFASTRKLLNRLDRLYEDHKAADLTLPIAYSKLANLELCGWLEESFDEVAHNCVRRKLRLLEERKLLNEKIGTTHGFDYNSNTRPLLAHALGVVRLTKIEKELERDGSLTKLKGTIGALKPVRRVAAHTTIAGTTITYPAPSIAVQRFEICLPIIQKMWVLVK